MKLREDQNQLIAEARREIMRGHRRICMQGPTGFGKSVVLGQMILNAVDRGHRVALVAHRIELVLQLRETVGRFGIKASLLLAGMSTPDNPVVIGMVQTMANRDIDDVELLYIDECHHATSNTYVKLIERIKPAYVIGMTATPARLDGKPLKDVFDTLVLGPTMQELIDRGSLAEYRYLAPENPELLDALKGIKKIGGDYAKGQLDTAVRGTNIVGDSVKYYREYMDSKPAIAFCVSVDHAREVAQKFKDAGYPAESIDGQMTKDQRRGVMARFRDGQTKVLTSCEIISEGLDVGGLQGVILLRPTQSLTLYLQQVGRALRPKEDGSKAIILDHVANHTRHGLPSDPRQWSLEGKVKVEPVSIRQCNKCFFVAVPHMTYLSCPTGESIEACGLLNAPSADRAGVKYLDGKLVEIKPEPKPVYADWAGNIDVKNATGQAWKALLRKAGDDEDRLREIARIRGMKPGWVWVRLKQLERYKR